MTKRNAERDAKIVALATEPSGTLSYAQIGSRFGVSKGAVSGVIFRHRHPELLHTSRPPARKVADAGAER